MTKSLTDKWMQQTILVPSSWRRTTWCGSNRKWEIPTLEGLDVMCPLRTFFFEEEAPDQARTISHPPCFTLNFVLPSYYTEDIAVPSCSTDDVTLPSCSGEWVTPLHLLALLRTLFLPPGSWCMSLSPLAFQRTLLAPLVQWGTLLCPLVLERTSQQSNFTEYVTPPLALPWTSPSHWVHGGCHSTLMFQKESFYFLQPWTQAPLLQLHWNVLF